ncbi:FlgD immunoglobulin-like domain containing protein, partial [Calditrichota bacterium]
MDKLKIQKTNSILKSNKRFFVYKFVFILFFAVFTLLEEIKAQDFWQQTNGPFGGSICAVAVSRDGHILAGSNGGGIFRSTDDGDNWAFSGLPNSLIKSIAVDTSSYIYAGNSEGVFRSDDNGLNWLPKNNGLTNTDITCIVVNTNNHVFAGTWDGGIFRSEDYGDNWVQVNNNLTNTIILSLTRNMNGHLFAGTEGGGIFRSIDNGDNWTQINIGLTDLFVLSLTVKPQNGFIFAGTYSGVFRSIDNGDNWTQINTGLTSIDILALIVNQAGHIIAGTYDGVFRSEDDGNNWYTINNGLTSYQIQAFALKEGSLIFMGTIGGIFRSANFGNNWDQINNGLKASIIISLTTNKSGEIFAGTEGGGLFRSLDMGLNWERVNNGLLNSHIFSLVINSNGHIFAGTYDGVFRSLDNGNNWTQINNNLTCSDIHSLAINSNDHIFAGTCDGVFRSVDNGNSWTQINTGLTRSIVYSLLVNKDNLVFAACDSGGLFRSTDNGDNWTLVNNGLTYSDILDITVNSNNVLFAGSYDGVFRSVNNGDNWIQINNGLTSIDIFSLVTDFKDHIFASTYEGVFISNNDGDLWSNVSSGLTNMDIFSLSLNPAGFLFAGSYGAGVFKSALSTSLAPPELDSPMDGATDLPLNPILNWNLVPGATTYEVQVDDDPSFNSLTWSQSVTTNSQQAAGLSDGITYYWRVNATDGINTSFWSDVWSFTTQALPIVVTQTATNIDNVSAQFNGMVNTKGHRVTVGFEFGESQSYGIYVNATPDTLINTSAEPVIANVNRLHTDRDYHYRIVVNSIDESFTVQGDDQMFRTGTYPAAIDVSTTISFPSHANATDFQATDYRIVGMPGQKEDRYDISLFLTGVHGNDWQAYWDNGTYSQNAADYLVEYNGGNEFKYGGGQALWIIHKGNMNITEQGIPTMPIDGDDNVRINLHNGWNLITCPFERTISWWEIQQANSISNPLYEFTGGWQNSEHLVPYHGYLFDNGNNLPELIVPYGVTFPKPLTDKIYNWRINIVLKFNGFVDNSNYLGVSVNSEHGYDFLDFRKPHAVGSIPAVYFSRPEWDEDYEIFATDIRPEILNIEKWDFSVTGSLHQNTTLTFSEIAEVPEKHEIYLLDEFRSVYVNIRDKSEYNFVPVTEVSNFVLLVGGKEAVLEELEKVIPQQFALGNNFPNPFNPVTIIPVSLPQSSEIKLKIYDLLGKEIKTVFSGPKDVGRHYFTWDGSNYYNRQVAAGVYLYRLIIGNDKTLVG